MEMNLLSAYAYSLLFVVVTGIWIQLCSASSYDASYSYAEYCASIVPESTTKFTTGNQDPLPGFPPMQAGFFLGGNSILGSSSSGSSKGMNFLSFINSGISKTDTVGLFKLDTSLKLRSSSILRFTFNYSTGYQPLDTSNSDPVNLWLTGFWSEKSGKLCMVGSGTGLDKGDKTLFLRVVLKLNYVSSPSITNSLITGTLQSLSSTAEHDYFEPISILAFSHLDYVYTLSTRDMAYTTEADGNYNRPLSSLPGGGLCSVLSRTPNMFTLMDTNTSSCDMTNKCTPFAGIDLKSFSWMSFDKFSCDEKNARVRAMINFHNNFQFYRADNLEASLIAEGIWDADRNQLVFKACRFYNTSGYLYEVFIGDCSIRISWRFPSVWSINDTSAVLGRMWSIKPAQDLLYFSEIRFMSNDVRMTGTQGLKYEYSKLDKVNNHCYKKTAESLPAPLARYPNGNSDEMKFGIFVSSSESRFALGASLPLFVNDLHYEDFSVLWSPKSKVAGDIQNISYRIFFTLVQGKVLPKGVASLFSKFNGKMVAVISAEGKYDTATGRVCMIGCRKAAAGNSSADCEIVVQFQLPPLGARASNASASYGYIKGSIGSLRDISDPLYFDHMDFTSSTIVSDVAKRQMALSKTKTTVFLLSEIVTCLLVLVQLRYITKQPKALPFISILMLLVLAIRFVVPLVSSLNLLVSSHSQDRHSSLSDMSRWLKLEAEEVITAVTTFMGLVLLLRLVHLACRSRQADQTTQNVELRAAEGKSLLSFILCYLIGALIVVVCTVVKEHRKPQYYLPSVIFQDLLLYSTFFPDLLFLLPQVFFNLFSNSKHNQPLSHLFYIGTAFCTLMPHLFGAAIVGSYTGTYQKGLMYLMAFLGLSCSFFIFLQQKFGAFFILFLVRCNKSAEIASNEANQEDGIELSA